MDNKSTPTDNSAKNPNSTDGWGSGGADMTRRLATAKVQEKTPTTSPESPKDIRLPSSSSDTPTEKVPDPPRRSTDPFRKSTDNKPRPETKRRSSAPDANKSLGAGIPRPFSVVVESSAGSPYVRTKPILSLDTSHQDRVAKFRDSLNSELIKQSNNLKVNEKIRIRKVMLGINQETLYNQCEQIVTSGKNITPETMARDIIQKIQKSHQDKVTKFKESLNGELSRQSGSLGTDEKIHIRKVISDIKPDALHNQCDKVIASGENITPETVARGIIQMIQERRKLRQNPNHPSV